MANEIEIFGKRLRIITDSNNENLCNFCTLRDIMCEKLQKLPCEDINGKVNRHFEEITL